MIGTYMKFALVGIISAVSLLLSGGVLAADYPDKPIRIVVPYPPGGASDAVTRLIGQQLSIRLKQPVLVENKPGAAAMIGSDTAARAPGDGYTLLMSGPASMVTNRFLYKRASRDRASFDS